MTGLFVLILLISIPAFFWSLFKPQTFQPLFKDKLAEKNIGRFFCLLAIVSFVGFGITSPDNKGDNNQLKAQPAATSQVLDQKVETQASEQTQPQQEKIEQPQQIQQPQEIQEPKEIQPQQKIQTETPPAIPEEKKPSASTSVKPTYTATSCREDYYKNSDGICVHSPSNNPSGATAQCRDGSYSYSLHRRGTCSGHGGVATWY